MDILKIIGIALVAVILIAILNQQKKEYAVMVSIMATILILSLIISKLDEVISLIQVFSDKAGIDENFVKIILKITGIAYITEFGANICKDTGESSIASKIELGGKVSIILLSIPVLMSLLDLLVSIMET